jgi:hypothetical protein
MKKEKQIRDRLNKLIADYFNKKFSGTDKYFAEARVRELVWVLDEVILMRDGKSKIGGEEKCQKIKKS